MVNITKSELLEKLMALRTASMVTIEAETDPRFLVKHRETKQPRPPSWNEAVKRAVANGVIGWHYQDAVNRQRVREDNDPNFEAQPRKWGERISGTPLVRHKGKFYLEFKSNRPPAVEYRTADGQVIPNDDFLAGFTKIRSSNAQHQGVAKEVFVSDYALDSIKSIKMGGVHYNVVEVPEVTVTTTTTEQPKGVTV